MTEGRAAVRVDNQPSDPQALRDIANSPQVQAVARRQAEAIRRDARRLAPRRTGNLRRHIVVEEITDLATGIEGFAIGWDDKGFYGQMVEFGTEDTAPQPHLVPAAVKNGARSPGGDR